MLNRHLSRSIVLQTLFEWDFRKESETEVFNILDYNLKEFAIVFEDNSFSKSLIKGVLKEQENLDNIKGILYIKDLLLLSGDDKNFAWQKLIRKPVFFVPENKRINDLLQEFRQKKYIWPLLLMNTEELRELSLLKI